MKGGIVLLWLVAASCSSSSVPCNFRFSKISGPCGCFIGADASALEPADAGND